MTGEPAWHVYILRTRLNSLYTGIATDIGRRMDEHAGGGAAGAKSLRAKGPLRLEYQACLGSRARASRVEYRIKRLGKPGKEAIVRGQPSAAELLELLELEMSEEMT